MSELKHQLMLNKNMSWVPCYSKAEVDATIAQLKAQNKRLKRALYKALANWAHEAKFDYDDEFSLWDKMERKCLKKMEEYK